MNQTRLHRRHPVIQFIMDNWIYILLLIVIWRLPYWLSDHFNDPIRHLEVKDTRGNQALSWMAVAIELYILAILAMSYNLLFGFTGILSFGHALFWGMGVYIVVILILKFSIPLMTTIGVALSFAAFFGLMASLASFRIKGVYFAMFTLALAQIFFELSRVSLFRFLTNGDDGLRLDRDVTPDIALNINRIDLYYVSGIAMILTFVFIRYLIRSPIGKVIIAVRDNEERAKTMGYNVYLYKTLVILLSSLLGTLAGVLNAMYTKGAEPSALGSARTVDPLIMTIIGGTGTNPGPVIGAAILHLGETFLSKPDLHIHLNFLLFDIATEVNTRSNWALALGVAFVVIVMVIPYGLVGQLNKWWIQIRRWFRRFVYDPLIRRNPTWANRMEPITGEPAPVALALAQQSKDQSVKAWILHSPITALYWLLFLIAVVVSLIRWDVSSGIDWFLFLWLITLPLVLVQLGGKKLRV